MRLGWGRAGCSALHCCGCACLQVCWQHCVEQKLRHTPQQCIHAHTAMRILASCCRLLRRCTHIPPPFALFHVREPIPVVVPLDTLALQVVQGVLRAQGVGGVGVGTGSSKWGWQKCAVLLPIDHHAWALTVLDASCRGAPDAVADEMSRYQWHTRSQRSKLDTPTVSCMPVSGFVCSLMGSPSKSEFHRPSVSLPLLLLRACQVGRGGLLVCDCDCCTPPSFHA